MHTIEELPVALIKPFGSPNPSFNGTHRCLDEASKLAFPFEEPSNN